MRNKNTYHKQKFVLQFLQSLRDNGELDVPIHSMNVKEWYALFQSKTNNISNVSLFTDARLFTLQMNNICYSNLFSNMNRVVKRNPEYNVYFEIHSSLQDDEQHENDILSISSSIDNEGKRYLLYIVIYYV